MTLREELVGLSKSLNPQNIDKNYGFTAEDAGHILGAVPSALKQWSKNYHIELTPKAIAEFTSILMKKAHYRKSASASN